MKFKKILVTGSSGFIASHVIDLLCSKGIETHLFDNTASEFNNNKSKEFIGDILNPSDIEKAMDGCDAVYHFAAQADIGSSSIDSRKTIETNIIGTHNVLEASNKLGIKRFLFASTIYVYSELGSFYRVSKQSCEKLIEEYQREYGIDYTILRYGSLYGPRANEFNAIRNFLIQALKNKKITRQGSGEEIREYIHVKDAAQLSISALGDEYINKNLIITGNQQLKVKNLLFMINEIFDGSLKIEFGSEDELHHYEITPYNYRPKIAKKITPNSYYDIGQGLMDQIYELELEIGKKDNKKKLSLIKKKK